MVASGLLLEGLRCWRADNQLPEDTQIFLWKEAHNAKNVNHEEHQ